MSNEKESEIRIAIEKLLVKLRRYLCEHEIASMANLDNEIIIRGTLGILYEDKCVTRMLDTCSMRDIPHRKFKATDKLLQLYKDYAQEAEKKKREEEEEFEKEESGMDYDIDNLKCNKCNKECDTLRGLAVHMSRAHGVKIKKSGDEKPKKRRKTKAKTRTYSEKTIDQMLDEIDANTAAIRTRMEALRKDMANML